MSPMLYAKFEGEGRAKAVYSRKRAMPMPGLTLTDAVYWCETAHWTEITALAAQALVEAREIKRGPRHGFGAVALGLVLGSLLGGCGCAAQTSLKGVEARLATKIDNSRKIDAQNVETFVSQEADKWVQRMLAGGLVLMGLSYPIGKVIWIVGERAKSTAANTLHTRKVMRRLNK